MNFKTRYMGLELANPIIVGASPFCDDPYVALQLQDAGAGAVVMRSLFEEQFLPPTPSRTSPRMDDSSPATDPLPPASQYSFSPEQYLRQLEALKRTLTIPVIASLNGHAPSDWITYARQLERAGADAIELNVYQVITDSRISADDVEQGILATVGTISGSVRIPVSVKLSPYHTALAQLALALELSGASGLVLFNRFYQPDINATTLEVQPQLRLSDSSELLLRLRWMAILSPTARGSLAAAGGIQTSEDIVKALLAGATAVQVVSVLLKHGPHLISSLLHGLEQWMRAHRFTDVEQFRGLLSLSRCPDASAFERANYIRALQQFKI